MAAATHPDNDKTIAEKIGVSPSTIGRWRSGDVDPKPRQVVGLARAYGKAPLSALIAAGYLAPEDLEGDMVVSLASDLDEVSTSQLLEELSDRVETMSAFMSILRSAGGGPSSAANLSTSVLRYLDPERAPAIVDGTDYIAPLADKVSVRDIGGTVYVGSSHLGNESSNAFDSATDNLLGDANVGGQSEDDIPHLGHVELDGLALAAHDEDGAEDEQERTQETP